MTCMVVALELMVMDEDVPEALRVFGWCRLLKVYAGIRWGDLQRLRPAEVEMRESGLVGRPTRTKTSGTGKRVRELPLFVPKEAFVAQEGVVGDRVRAVAGHRELLPGLLPPAPVGEPQGVREEGGLQRGRGALRQEVLARLRRPRRGQRADAEWESSDERLMPACLAVAWTGHSERATMVIALAALGVERQKRDMLGRWCPDGSNH